MKIQSLRPYGVVRTAVAASLSHGASMSQRLSIALLLCGLASAPGAFAQGAGLGTATPFAVLGASAISSSGATVVTGDLGISPSNASSVTGFTFSTPPGGGQVIGATHFANAVALTAQGDATTAYNTLAGLPCSAPISADLGGLTLNTGVYCSASTMGLTGTLTLDAQGDPDAVFVFQIGSQLTTASNSRVVVVNGGRSCNVFWQVGSSATLGTGTQFLGNLIALTSISVNTASQINGRLLARTAAVTLQSAAVTVCSLIPPGVVLPPTVAKSFTPASIAQGATSTLTLTLTNPDASVSTLTSPFTDTLPAGVLIASPPSATTTCGGTGSILAVPGGSGVGLTAGYTIPANGSCSLTVSVTSNTVGTHVNTVAVGALVTSTGSNATPASATLTVTGLPPPPVAPPQVSKQFSPPTVVTGFPSVLTITLTNPATTVSTLTAALSDFLPSGLVVAAPPASSTTCSGGALAATAGGTVVTIPVGVSIPANGSCVFTVNVTAAQAGSYVNTIPAGALVTNTGVNVPPTVATITVTPPGVVPPPPTAGPILPIPALDKLALLLLGLVMAVVAGRALRTPR